MTDLLLHLDSSAQRGNWHPQSLPYLMMGRTSLHMSLLCRSRKRTRATMVPRHLDLSCPPPLLWLRVFTNTAPFKEEPIMARWVMLNRGNRTIRVTSKPWISCKNAHTRKYLIDHRCELVAFSCCSNQDSFVLLQRQPKATTSHPRSIMTASIVQSNS